MPQTTYQFKGTTITTSANGDATPALFSVIGGVGGETLADWLADDGATPLQAQITGSGTNDFTEHLIIGGWEERTSAAGNDEIPENAEVVSVTVKMNGARTSGSGAFRAGSNAVRLPVEGEAYDDLTTALSALTSFSTSGVAEVSITLEDSVDGPISLDRLRDPTMQLQYRLNHTSSGSVGVHEPPTLEIVVNIAAPSLEPSQSVRGRDWGGDPQVAAGIILGAGGWPKMFCGIDSLFSDSYYPSDNGNTSLVRGILNTWDVPVKGLTILCAGQSGTNWGHLHTEAAPTNATLNRIAPGYSIAGGQPMEPTGLATGLFPCYVNLYTFTGNVADDSSMLRDWIVSTTAATNYARGNWFAGKAMTATLIAYNFAGGATVQFQALRPFETDIENQVAVDTSDGVGFTSTTLALPLDGTDTDPGSRVRSTNDGADESTKFFIAVATRLRLAEGDGIEVVGAGISGTSAAFHTEAAGNYTNAQLQALFAELDIDTVVCCSGMNSGLNPDKATYKAAIQNFRDRCINALLANGVARPRFLMLSPYANESGTASDAVEMGEAVVEMAAENPHTLGLNLYSICGEDTGDYRVDTVHPNHAGSDFFMSKVAQMLRHIAGLASGGDRGGSESLRINRR